MTKFKVQTPLYFPKAWGDNFFDFACLILMLKFLQRGFLAARKKLVGFACYIVIGKIMLSKTFISNYLACRQSYNILWPHKLYNKLISLGLIQLNGLNNSAVCPGFRPCCHIFLHSNFMTVHIYNVWNSWIGISGPFSSTVQTGPFLIQGGFEISLR